MKSEKSPDSKYLCRLLLVPLGISANLHLCQLDVADDIGVWKTKTGRDLFPARAGNVHKSST